MKKKKKPTIQSLEAMGDKDLRLRKKASEDQKKLWAEKRKKAFEKAIEAYVRKLSNPTEREVFRAFLVDLIRNNAIPLELFEFVPVKAQEQDKTRFDQLYDAALALSFPGYTKGTLEKLLGAQTEYQESIKIWRVMFPQKFQLSHVLIRARDIQEAFALGADYACRSSLASFRRIPADLTLRIQFVSEKAVRRMLLLRMANRKQLRRKRQLIGRDYSNKEIYGARIAALGNSPKERSIFRYMEYKDLLRILRRHGKVRVSLVESEVYKRESAKNLI